MFVTAVDEKVGRQVYVARPGFHNHFPVWSPDGAFIYFVQGLPLEESDVWRIRPTGGEPERLTFHNSRVTFPTLLGNRTLMYLATDDDGSGPWIYAMDIERRVPHRISTGVEESRRSQPAPMADASLRPFHARRRVCGECQLPTTSSTDPAPLQSRSRLLAACRRERGPGTSSIGRQRPGRMAS